MPVIDATKPIELRTATGVRDEEPVNETGDIVADSGELSTAEKSALDELGVDTSAKVAMLTDDMLVIGVTTTRAWRHKHGEVSAAGSLHKYFEVLYNLKLTGEIMKT